jgi:hypothetical protein
MVKVGEGIGDAVCVGDCLVAMGATVGGKVVTTVEAFPHPVKRNIKAMDSMINFFIREVLSCAYRFHLHKVRLASIKP